MRWRRLRKAYHRKFNQMMDDEQNDGVSPPKHPKTNSGDIAKKYPRAAMYIKAEEMSFGRHPDKVGAGERAMEIIESGGNLEDAQKALDEWEKGGKAYD